MKQQAEEKETGDIFDVVQVLFDERELFNLTKFCGVGCFYGPFKVDSEWFFDVGWKSQCWPDGLLYIRCWETCWLIRRQTADTSGEWTIQARTNEEFLSDFTLLINTHYHEPIAR